MFIPVTVLGNYLSVSSSFLNSFLALFVSLNRPIEQSKFVLNVKRIIFVIYDSLGFKVILYDRIVIWFGNKF